MNNILIAYLVGCGVFTLISFFVYLVQYNEWAGDTWVGDTWLVVIRFIVYWPIGVAYIVGLIFWILIQFLYKLFIWPELQIETYNF